MQGIYKHYIIDLSCDNNFVQVPTVQGDGNNIRGFEVELIANNVQYVVNPATTLVWIGGTKPDTNPILNECSITSEGYILVDITQQMAAVAGRGDYSIVLTDKDTNSQMKSFPFYILTTASPYSASDIISGSEFGTLTKAITDVNKLKTEMEDSEATRTEAENQRIANEKNRQSNETIRINNENNRKSAESKRVTAENLRNTSEQTRENAEVDRNAAEQTRINNENTRQSNETIRINNENSRKTAENKRATAETNRIAAEETREDAEAIRQANEKERIANEIVRQNQEDIRQINTNAAISNANTSADYAKEQGDYANEQGGLANLAATNATSVANDLIEKRDSGYFKGDKGDPGKDGVVTTISGMFAFNINSSGHLILTYSEVDEPPNFSINSSGHLIYSFS